MSGILEKMSDCAIYVLFYTHYSPMFIITIIIIIIVDVVITIGTIFIFIFPSH